MQNLPSTLKSVFVSGQWASIWIPWLIVGLSCPVLIRLAPVLRLFDNPGESARKIHHQVKPLGGAAILIGFLPVLFLYGTDWAPLLSAVLVVFFTGLVDDIRGLSPKLKLVLQVLAATIVVLFHPFPATNFSLSAGVGASLSGIPNLIFLGFWLVGGTNAFNLIDGLDGLAAGVGLISLLPLLVLGFGQASSFLVAGLVGGLIAILVYNFYPAKLFLGDGGSYLLGFLVSFLVIDGLSAVSPGGSGWPVLAGIALLGVPIIDTVMAIFRRARSGKGIMEADQGHLHHRLYRKFGHVTAVLVIYLVQVALSSLLFIIH